MNIDDLSAVIPKVFNSKQLPIEATQDQLVLITPTIAASYPVGGIPSAISSLPGIGSAGALAAAKQPAFPK